MTAWIKNLEITGNKVYLRPLELSDVPNLNDAAADGNLWELWYTSVPSPDTAEAYVKTAISGRENGNMYPFVICEKETGKAIGSTRYCSIEPAHRRVEIGYTWYAKSVQQTGINTECKYLLLKHAFENLGCICVQFKTHWHNLLSRKAIERLGAKLDGVLRNDRVGADGTIRDTVVYSIIESEWPAVKQSLEFMMKRKY
jgi:RimJ/RimL family protein N-acetyltransferase